MRAAVFQGVGRGLAIEDVPLPVPGPGQVRLRVGACGICGSDLDQARNGSPYMPPGYTPGHEYAGEVVQVGPGAEGLSVGDRIVAPPIQGCGSCAACLQDEPMWCTGDRPARRVGAYAEYVLSAAQEAIMLPESLTWADGALVEPLAVGLHGVGLSRTEPGARVAIIGAGPIGLAALFWLRQRSAGPVVMLAATERRKSIATTLGATGFLAGEIDPGAVAEMLGGAPDYVFEAAGHPGTIAKSIDVVAPRGTVIVLGACSVPDRFVPFTALMKEVRLQFAVTYSQRELQHVVDTLSRGNLVVREMITSTVSLDELPAKFNSLLAGSQDCKVIIDPWA